MCKPNLAYELACEPGLTASTQPAALAALPFAHSLFEQSAALLAQLQAEKPWKRNPNYFQKAYISSLALMKMTIHAHSGGDIEVMGMMLGKLVAGGIVVLDAYALPVEGTETRVNAHEDSYEFMVQYLESYNKTAGRDGDRIVGWYHSHPGYGCWLSGIDVATEKLQQKFQDPFLAVVIDPHQTMRQGRVEIGAFRTYEDGTRDTGTHTAGTLKGTRAPKIPKSKAEDFGAHADDYYALAVELFKSEVDNAVLETCVATSWTAALAETPQTSQMRGLTESVAGYVLALKDTRALGVAHSLKETLRGTLATRVEDNLSFGQGEMSDGDDKHISDVFDMDSESDVGSGPVRLRVHRLAGRGMKRPPGGHALEGKKPRGTESTVPVNTRLAALAKQARAAGADESRALAFLQVQKGLFLQERK
ncbi:hypothetical protein BABINDRAFT_161937 [Babjeviella inositovora NRRL Y-12698]|uniref:COP9 signalosome complex subunit 5 n=1 Tax=Babjeviella inositovora NRRL Y-12698 TaxID=984486 RepID=A0A1E3QPG3_9ASCO|nr:uncharacterized protein BABINDRAFT_161937 [Babjeviella inositovora NRRL Y-12698]ODQ79551.1 hypothetical protein BABINDRAFT_161937 [Babjeviella inositovora NRRL Y-12698]